MRRWLIVALLLSALAVLGGGAWLARPAEGLPPAVSVAGVDVGGRSLADAKRVLRRAASWRVERPILLFWGGGRIEVSGSLLGAEPEIAAALRRAQRARNALSRLAARLRLTGKRDLPLAFRLDPDAVEHLVLLADKRVSRPARPATVKLVGPKLVLVRARPGRAVDRAALEAALARLPATIEVPVRAVPAEIRDRAALRAKAQAGRLFADPPAVVYAGRRVELTPSVLRSALRFRPRGRTLAVSLALPPLVKRLRPAFRGYESKPRDARFRVRGKKVALIPARTGRRLAIEKIAAALLATRGRSEISVRFDLLPPALTTAEAKAMRVRELVSEFATPYPCCAPRVTNIERAAQILDGTIIPAGGVFSLNKALGPRTPERGFVPAPMIARGRLVDSVGGGVSQVATTFYNAAFFAGLRLIEHTPHQFYISRYPMGREATVSWGGPELVFGNDWPAAILVKVDAGPSSISVRFYSSKLGRRVETETGQPYDFRPARVRTVVNRSLPPGSRRVVQRGGVAGFSVWYVRRVFRGRKLLRSARFYVRYDPEDTIVEIGPRPERERKPRPEKPKKPGQRPSDRPVRSDDPPEAGAISTTKDDR